MKSFSGAGLANMVERSKAKNEQQGITAVLLHRQGTFLHGIEGEAAKVRALYSILCADPRHRDLEVLVETRVSQRLFSAEPMGFYEADLEKLKTAKNAAGRFGPSAFAQDFSWRGCIALQLLAPFRS